MHSGANKKCGKCGGFLEAGNTTALELIAGASEEHESRLIFVVLGTDSSNNPLKAFQQGLANEPADRHYRIVGFRCSQCGALELYAEDRV
ncbi:MAG TPA: hypothetical protein VHB99_07875 [Pirellulales bacterium]|nr:hypothetical protein [Pirellulales bacterium]